jgi:hypothetical protein
MNKLSTQLAVVWTATAMALVFMSAPMVVRAAEATNVFCDQTLMQDTKMDGDLTCSSDLFPFAALIIGADNVTLDLNGFTITGDSGMFAGVFLDDGLTGITIKNGTIQDSQVNVFAGAAVRLKLSDLIIKNHTNGGVQITEGGEDVVIRNSSFLAPAPRCDAGTVAMSFVGVTNLDVNNVDVHGGFSAVLIDCALCDGLGFETPNTGKIRNSTFTETNTGMFIANTTDLTVSNNHFSNIVSSACFSGDAITVAPVGPGPAPRTGIKIWKNFIHDNVNGILLFGVVAGAEIKENQVHINIGIGLFESTGNLIKNNITFDNGVDLFHNELSSPNTWKNNSCETKFGADIPEC